MNMHQMQGLGAWTVLLLSGFAVSGDTGAIGTPYDADLEYRQTITRIVERSDVMWAGVPAESNLGFGFVSASEDASRVFFNVACSFWNQSQL